MTDTWTLFNRLADGYDEVIAVFAGAVIEFAPCLGTAVQGDRGPLTAYRVKEAGGSRR